MEINPYYDNSRLYEYKAKNHKLVELSQEENLRLKKLNHKKRLMHGPMEMID